jgi:hypothetical protein
MAGIRWDRRRSPKPERGKAAPCRPPDTRPCVATPVTTADEAMFSPVPPAPKSCFNRALRTELALGRPTLTSCAVAFWARGPSTRLVSEPLHRIRASRATCHHRCMAAGLSPRVSDGGPLRHYPALWVGAGAAGRAVETDPRSPDLPTQGRRRQPARPATPEPAAGAVLQPGTRQEASSPRARCNSIGTSKISRLRACRWPLTPFCR